MKTTANEIRIVFRVDLKKHFWWCWFWQAIYKREPNDYDGVCLNCGFNRHTLQSYKRNIIKKRGEYV